jgi:hypothetical protein
MSPAALTAEPGYVTETLAWCNQRRAERGKKPLKRLPKGKRMVASSCPCGKATGLSVFPHYYDGSFNGWRQKTPEAVANFIVAFDDGKLPEYDENMPS